MELTSKRIIDLTVEEFQVLIGSEIKKNHHPFQQVQKKHYTRNDAIEKLDCSLVHLHKLINEGILTKYKQGRRTFLLVSEVDALIDKGRV